MGILPVYLFHKSDPVKKIKVYALLDNASGGTFVSEESMKALGIEGSDTDLILTTIHGMRSVTTKAIEGLVVANIKEKDVMLDLPRTFTRRVIPADRNEIPRPDVICKMPHLEKISTEIPPYMADIKVGLLIGLNCPGALRPREIVYGEESDPYAVRSLLGWYVNGPLCTSQQIDKITCNRIRIGQEDTLTTPRGYVVSQRMVKEQITPQAVRQMFELDFSERTERNNKTKSAKGRTADFEEFSQFVREQAELATDPVFSEEIVSKPHHDEKDKGTHFKFRRGSRSRGKGTSLATGLKQEGRNKQSASCSLCKKPHNLNDCEQFLTKTLTERREFVMEKKLCFGCFSDQHIAKNCKERQTCKTCKKQHPTSLCIVHDNDWAKKTSNNSHNQSGAEPCVSSNRTAICNITKLEMYLSTWVYYQFTCFTRVIQ